MTPQRLEKGKKRIHCGKMWHKIASRKKKRDHLGKRENMRGMDYLPSSGMCLKRRTKKKGTSSSRRT